MTQLGFEIDILFERCKTEVARVLGRYNWHLLTFEEMTQRTQVTVAAGEITDPRAAAVNVYCQCLYIACCGDEGVERQNRAFLELQHYLFELSFREAADIPYDIRIEHVNETLLRIWQRLDAYHKPGAFLAIAAMELRNVLRPWWMRGRHHHERQPWKQPPTSIEKIPEQVDDTSADPITKVLSEEFALQVQDCFDNVLERYPRARQQLEAVWFKYVAGYDDETISHYLNKPVASIHVLRSRGLSRLRAEPSWQFLAQELGIEVAVVAHESKEESE